MVRRGKTRPPAAHATRGATAARRAYDPSLTGRIAQEDRAERESARDGRTEVQPARADGRAALYLTRPPEASKEPQGRGEPCRQSVRIASDVPSRPATIGAARRSSRPGRQLRKIAGARKISPTEISAAALLNRQAAGDRYLCNRRDDRDCSNRRSRAGHLASPAAWAKCRVDVYRHHVVFLGEHVADGFVRAVAAAGTALAVITQ